MSTQSPYAITLTPAGGATITLVALGGWLETLPILEASQDLYESDGVQLGAAFFRPLGNVAVTILFTTEEDHEDLAAALDVFLAADVWDGTSVLTLSGLLEVGAFCEFADAVVTVVTPDLPSGRAATTTRDFTIRTSLPTLI